MPLDDQEISAAVGDGTVDGVELPYPGTWRSAPYPDADGRAEIAVDEGLSRIVVDRESGALLLVDHAGEGLLNSSVGAFARSAAAYVAAATEAAGVDPDGRRADAKVEKIGKRLAKELRRIDPAAVRSEDAFWSVVAEELGYGVLAPLGADGTDEPVPMPAFLASWEAVLDARPGIGLLTGPDQHPSDLHYGGWRTIETAARVFETTDPAALAEASRPVAVLITAAATAPLTAAVLDLLPDLAIVCHLGDGVDRVVTADVRARHVTVHEFGLDADGVHATGNVVLQYMTSLPT